MTNEAKHMFDNVKEAFAPVNEALKNLENLEVPEAARDFVKRTVSTAKDRTAEAFAGSEKVTAVIESAIADSVSEAARITRTVQKTIYEDAEAFFAGIDRLASAKSFGEVVHIQAEMVRTGGEAFVSRAKSTTEYLGKLVTDGAKTAQDNFSKVYNKTA